MGNSNDSHFDASDADDDAQMLAELEVAMASLSEPITPSPDLLLRLQRAVATPPLRYAPFYDRLAELFDWSEETVVAELTRLASPNAWRFAGLPGVRNIIVRGGPRTTGAETLFARFEPGTRFPAHRHSGVETVLVLEGEYLDSHGLLHSAGELRSWQPGSDHSFRVSQRAPCIIASIVYGREFEAAPLRWLARMLGR